MSENTEAIKKSLKNLREAAKNNKVSTSEFLLYLILSELSSIHWHFDQDYDEKHPQKKEHHES